MTVTEFSAFRCDYFCNVEYIIILLILYILFLDRHFIFYLVLFEWVIVFVYSVSLVLKLVLTELKNEVLPIHCGKVGVVD